MQNGLNEMSKWLANWLMICAIKMRTKKRKKKANQEQT